ncbi:MAG: preprotein translocase subunit SecG [Chitinophagales bacterium]
MFFTFLVILIVIVCLFITLIVLIQNPKGGGLTGGVGNTASNIIGVQSAGDVMEKTTWGSAILLMLLCVCTAFVLPKDDQGNAAVTQTMTEEAAKLPTAAQPVMPQPSQQQAQPQQQQAQPAQPASNPLSQPKK